MAVTYLTTTSGCGVILCLAADTKPATNGGATLIETDTAKMYYNVASVWTLYAPVGSAAAYNPNLYITTADQTITANSSIVFASEYQIGSGFLTTLNSGSILQIT